MWKPSPPSPEHGRFACLRSAPTHVGATLVGTSSLAFRRDQSFGFLSGFRYDCGEQVIIMIVSSKSHGPRHHHHRFHHRHHLQHYHHYHHTQAQPKQQQQKQH